MDDFEKLMQVLNANAGKTFVQRILKPDNYPVLHHDNGIATHRMATAEADGKFYAYPTVLWNGQQLQDYGNDAFRRAWQTGNMIEFPSSQEADWFSRNYKSAWGGKRGYMEQWEQNRRNTYP